MKEKNDPIAEAEFESFPASDPPSYAGGFEPPPRRQVSVPLPDGCEIHGEITGVGPRVLFLHAFPLGGWMWQAVAERLDICSIALDLRGHGASGVSPDSSVEQLADDAIQTLDALGLGGPTIVCGCSLGALVALELYHNYRHRVRALVLSGCRPEADPPARVAEREALALRVEEQGSAAVAPELTRRMLAASTTEELHDRVRRAIGDTPPGGIAATSRALARRRDYSVVARSIDCPTLLVYGLLDQITPPELGVSLYSDIDASRLELISGAAHLAPLEQPDGFAYALGAFVARLNGARHIDQHRERGIHCVRSSLQSSVLT